MTKNEFMNRLKSELNKRNVSDFADIIEEYEQHFNYKMADGYSEEEIAAKLGDPIALAAQFGESDTPEQKSGNKPFVIAGLCVLDLFAAMFYILLAAWEIVMAAAGIAFAGVSVCLLFNTNVANLIPSMPYPCAALLGIALLALSALAGVGCVYYFGFLRQLFRAFCRFQHNAIANASGTATLPALAVNPQFSAKLNRRLRSSALISLAVFAAFFILGYIVCTITAGSFEFWHVWGWFM